MNKKQLVTTCIEAAAEFLKTRPWLRLSNDDVILFDLPGEEYELSVTVMGAAGEEFGLLAFMGPDATEAMLSICDGQAELTAPMIAMSLEDRANFAGPFLRQIEQAGCKGRTAPLLFAMDIGGCKRPLNRTELEAMTRLLRVMADLAKRDGLTSVANSPRNLLPVLQVEGTLRRPKVQMASRPRQATSDASGQLPQLPSLQADWVVADHRLLVGLEYGGTSAEDNQRAIYILLVIEDGGSGLMHAAPILGHDLAAAASELFKVFRGETSLPGNLPQQITFADLRLFQALEGALMERGMDCGFEDEVEPLRQIYADLTQHLHPDDAARFIPRLPIGIPADDDLAAWKAIDKETVDLPIAKLPQPFEAMGRLWVKYFGTTREDSKLEPEAYGDMKTMAFIEWCILHHRPSKRGMTAMERVLASRDLHPAVRCVLEARKAATVSIYRVTAVDVGESVELLDITTGEPVTLTDRSLSTSAELGAGLILLVYPAGGFHFAILAGPVVPGIHLSSALDFLQDEIGLDLAGDGPRRTSHLFGRLWEWMEQAVDLSNLRLQNSDGDALLWHSASFAVKDVDALAASLDRRPEFESSPNDDGWDWIEGSGNDQQLHLGQLSLIGDNLLLEVNSAERFTAGRRLVESLDGELQFESVTQKSIDPRAPSDRPLDDRLPSLPESVQVPEEVLEQVRAMLHQRYMSWLDESIPMLDGKTPRQSCATEAGRRKVAQMIRSYADPGGVPGVVVPRDEMLRELGLA